MEHTKKDKVVKRAKVARVLHKCMGMKQNDDYGMPGPRGKDAHMPCRAWYGSNEDYHDLCGEPCSFIMHKGGSAYPERPQES